MLVEKPPRDSDKKKCPTERPSEDLGPLAHLLLLLNFSVKKVRGSAQKKICGKAKVGGLRPGPSVVGASECLLFTFTASIAFLPKRQTQTFWRHFIREHSTTCNHRKNAPSPSPASIKTPNHLSPKQSTNDPASYHTPSQPGVQRYILPITQQQSTEKTPARLPMMV